MRKATTSKLPVAPALHRESKRSFQKKIATAVDTYKIKKDLIFNFDQTPLAFISPGSYTMDPKGLKKVPIQDENSKYGITGTIVVTATGVTLPFLLIYSGETERIHQKGVVFPTGFNLLQNESHWANEKTSFDLINKIILPYIEDIKKEKKPPSDEKALQIFDVFRGQKTIGVLEFLTSKNCIYVFVPANMTDKNLPMDSTVNKRIMSIIKNCYNSWYSQQVMDQLSTGVSPTEIKIKQLISIIKPLHAGWIINAHEDLRSEAGIASILKGFANCAIEEAVDQAEELATGCDDSFE